MLSEQINWETGQVVYWDLGFLDNQRPLIDQLDGLKEDLAQVRYGDLLLDLGWYPEFSGDGEFVVRVVCRADWDAPVFQDSSRSVEGLLLCLETAIRVACDQLLISTPTP